MAYADMNRTATAGFPTLRTPSIFAPVVAMYRAHKTRKVLSNLSNRELDDIGLARADIDTVAKRIRG